MIKRVIEMKSGLFCQVRAVVANHSLKFTVSCFFIQLLHSIA